jgi:hypothetical protein
MPQWAAVERNPSPFHLTRRRFAGIAGGAFASMALGACRTSAGRRRAATAG